MKIYFSSYHRYPGRLHGVASHAVHDNLVKGLCELGHEVWYQLQEPPEVDLPHGAYFTDRRIKDADIYHINDGPLVAVPDDKIPWVRILHCDVRIKGYPLSICQENWIYVSKTLAHLYGSRRYVLNGINPDEFVYAETKDDYLFFIVGGLERAEMKGLDVALTLARETGIKLKIAGTSNDPKNLDAFRKLCEEQNVTFCGPVYGEKKAELFAGAKALLFPSKYNEACPLVIAEALMSGTPVIASANGSIPELINEQVGFICREKQDYLRAIDIVDDIDAKVCRAYAMENFHYLKMAKGYIAQYEYELEKRAITV